MAKKRCLFCRLWFEPYLPMAKLQQVCGASECRRKFKRMLDRAWRRRDPQWGRERRRRRRGRRRVYMRHYRAKHPDYRAREVARIKRGRANVRKTGVVVGVFVEGMQETVVRQEFIDTGKRLRDNTYDADRGGEP